MKPIAVDADPRTVLPVWGRSDTAQVPESAQALIDELTITGDPATVGKGLDRWYDAGADMPVVVLPPNASREDLDRTLVALRPQ